MARLTLEKLGKRYGRVQALSDIDLAIERWQEALVYDPDNLRADAELKRAIKMRANLEAIKRAGSG